MLLIDSKNDDEWKGGKLVVVENRNLEGVEVGVQLEDLDSSCSGGHSEGEGSDGECSLTRHGLSPIVIGCITHTDMHCCSAVFY